MKKLALNRGDNPYIVADRFLADEDLPPEYKGQVCAWFLHGGHR